MKNASIVLLLLFCIGGFIGYSVYNKPHKNIQSAVSDFTLSATELYSSFEENEKAANEKYLDKTLQITGIIADVSKDKKGQLSLVLEAGGLLGGVICNSDNFSDNNGFDNPKIGQQITIKGLCTGMLTDVVLVRCVQI